MKPQHLITALAATALLITGCGNNDTQADAPEPTRKSAEQMQLDAQAKRKAQEAQDGTPQAQDAPAQDEASPLPDYQSALASEHILLTDEELDRVGYQACIDILYDRMVDPDEYLGVTTRDDISRGRVSAMVQLHKLDADTSHDQAITYAAIHHLCPEVLDQLDDGAEHHNIFREDRRAEPENE